MSINVPRVGVGITQSETPSDASGNAATFTKSPDPSGDSAVLSADVRDHRNAIMLQAILDMLKSINGHVAALAGRPPDLT